jgi:heptosyltransferase-2
MGLRILIIKLGALGDVVRTACLLPALRRSFGQTHVTWVTKPNGVRILRGHPLIDVLMAYDAESVTALAQQEFDLVISLDKESGPAGLCNAVKAPDKRGMRLSQWGTAQPCDTAAERYMILGLDDELKFRGNAKSYPELVHEAMGLEYVREPYRLYCDAGVLSWALAKRQSWQSQITGPIIGLNVGAGPVYAHKAPSVARWESIARQLLDKGYSVAILAGPDEAQAHAALLRRFGDKIIDTGFGNTEQQFMAIVGQCAAVVTGDSLALHVAVAREVPVVALFGPTCHQEIDLFDRGVKLVTGLDCAPCYRRQCDKTPNCMDAISDDTIVNAVESVLRQSKDGKAGQ